MRKLVIIGAGGFGREVLAWAEQSVEFQRDWTIKGFIDDNLDALVGKKPKAELLGTIRDYQPNPEDVFVCALGQPEPKRKCSELILSRGGELTRLTHRTAILGHNVDLSDGVILCPYVVVSANNRLGRCVAVDTHSTINHDAKVGDWTQISCYCDLTAAVEIGGSVFLGSHVSVVPGVKIGEGAYVGAGTIVIRDVEAGAKMVGVPARRIN